MIEEFKSIDELYERVLPALSIKVDEAKKLNNNILEIDIWNYLINSKWKMGNNLMLSDIVNDILNVDLENINKSQGFDKNSENI